jgi:hypothetical protein
MPGGAVQRGANIALPVRTGEDDDGGSHLHASGQLAVKYAPPPQRSSR